MCDEDVPKGTVVGSHLYMKREDAVTFLAELILKVYPELVLISDQKTSIRGIENELAEELGEKDS